MGLFSSIFGSGGSDKADKLRQQAIDAFNSIKTPELSALQVQLDKYVQAGKMTPEQAEVQLLGSNAFNSVVTDPSFVGAQKQALQQMQAIGSQGGLTAIDKAQLNDITNQQNQQNRSQNEATMQQAQQRGVGGSDLNAVNQLINEQGNADRAANQGLGVAAQAQARALAAMQAAGQQGGALESQQYGEQANKAQAQNAIDVFNKQALNQTNLFNTQSANAAQAANLANAQAVANANTATGNQNKTYNAQQNQQVFEDAMKKAQGMAGVETGWANDAQRQAENERNASAGLISGALNAGATAAGAAFGGPAGAMAANQLTDTASQSTPGSTNSNYKRNSDGSYNFAEGGEVHDESCGYNEGGMCMKHGGSVPGHAEVSGDSPKNDTVSAKLSPGEVVVPRSAMQDDAEFEAFMAKFRPSAQHKKMAKGGIVSPAIPRVNNTNPMRDTVHNAANPVPLAATNDANDFSQMMNKFKPKKPSTPVRVPPEVHALSNLHQRISKLEGK